MYCTPRGQIRLAIACTALGLGTALVAQDAPKKIPQDKEVQEHPSGIAYSILQPGTGKVKPEKGDSALINFSEWLADGTHIESSEQPVRINIGDPNVRLGLQVGASLVTKGGKVKLTVPPERAYGKQGVIGHIPPNSTMIYVVELLDYQYRPKPAQFWKGDPAKTKTTKSGMKYEVLTEGKGGSPSGRDIVEIEFTIWSVDGQMLGGTFKGGQTMTAPVGQMSHAFFREVLPMMKKGSVWRIVAPADLTAEQVQQDTVWQVELINTQKTPAMPPGKDEASTSTKSGLYFERLAPGKGDRPRTGYVCELEWDFWREDGSWFAGSMLQGDVQQIVGKSTHKFLDEILLKMQIGEVMRVEVPDTQTAPRMIPFKTIWRLKLVSMKRPLPLPGFQLPKDEELTKTASGLKYKVLERGDGKGASPKMGQSVTVHYAGWLTDGTAFDSSYSRSTPMTFPLGTVIEGWNEGLQLMKPGDTYLFVIPGNLAYGARGTPDGTIPPDATLVFHVKLLPPPSRTGPKPAEPRVRK